MRAARFDSLTRRRHAINGWRAELGLFWQGADEAAAAERRVREFALARDTATRAGILQLMHLRCTFFLRFKNDRLVFGELCREPRFRALRAPARGFRNFFLRLERQMQRARAVLERETLRRAAAAWRAKLTRE